MDLAVVLIDTRNPLNIGAVARAMANFGFSDLRLVNPYDQAFREAVSAVGGAHVLQWARVYENVASAVADRSLVVGTTAIGNRELQHPLHPLSAARGSFGGVRAAILFGSEKFGLSNDDLSFCHWLMRIPTVPDTPSMNLGQAVAVCLYELIRDPDTSLAIARHRAPDGSDAEQLTRMMLEVLEVSGYTNRIVATSTERKIRRFFRRVRIQYRDAPLLLGILRQLLWKLRGTRQE